MTDALNPGELTALSLLELGQILNEIDTESAPLVQIAANDERELGRLQGKLIRDPDDTETKAKIKEVSGRIRRAKILLSAYRQRQSRVQTILRTMQTTGGI